MNQTILEDIEVIMVDDGSTDDSRYIIERYALDYENFHAFHKENEGQGIARNYGLKKARGKYIHFLDSDDYVMPDCYEKMLSLAESGDYDFVVANVLRFALYNCWDNYLLKQSFRGLNENREFKSLDEFPSLVWDTLAVNKLYKKEFLEENNIEFPDKNIYYEDLIFSFEVYLKSDNFCYLNEYIYYWRLRSNNTSVTQQMDDIKNFRDRLEILRGKQGLVLNSNLNQATIDTLHEKWMLHDLMMFIKNINGISSKYHAELLDDISHIISAISQSVKDKLPSYHRIIYKMIDDGDVDGLLKFAPAEDDFKRFNFELDDKYSSLLDFKRDALNQDLDAKKTGIQLKDDNLVVSFEYDIPYVPESHPHRIKSALVSDDGTRNDLNIKDGEIVIPVGMIFSRNCVRISIEYSCDEFIKKTFLKSYARSNILLDDKDLEMAIGVNNEFIINVRNIKPGIAEIARVAFDDGCYIFEGESDNEIGNVIIENFISHEKFTYPVQRDNSRFKFKIPKKDVINRPIKKWELKSDSLIYLTKEIRFFKDYNNLSIKNARNKILIEDNVHDKNDMILNFDRMIDENQKLISEIENLTDKNNKLANKYKKLKKKNKKLIEKNKKLKNIIEEYKSRKAVRIANKLKFGN